MMKAETNAIVKQTRLSISGFNFAALIKSIHQEKQAENLADFKQPVMKGSLLASPEGDNKQTIKQATPPLILAKKVFTMN